MIYAMQGKIRVANILKFIIVYSVLVSVGEMVFHMPRSLFYVNDLLMVIAVIGCSVHIQRKNMVALPKSLSIVSVLLLGATILSFILNQYTPLYYLWGFRNNFRAFLYFLCCCMCMNREDLNEICDMFVKLLPVNIVLCTIQYILAINSGDQDVLKFVGDHVGGVFGNVKGCNRILNIYILFVFMWALTMYLKKEKNGMYFLLSFVGCAYLAILSELKILVLEFLIVAPVLVNLIKKGTSKVLYGFLFLFGFFAFTAYWAMTNPLIAAMLNSVDTIIDYSSADSYGTNAVNRLTVIPVVYDVFFEGDIWKLLFGIGLGNADTSNFAFLSTPIAARYGYLRYNIFQSGFLFLEIGLVGMALFIAFFVVNYLSFTRYIKKAENLDPLVYIGGVFNLVAILCIFYNTSLRSEVSNYITFFILAMPIICAKDKTQSAVKRIADKKELVKFKKIKIRFTRHGF